MVTLYHHALCPHSRYVRIVMGEFGMDARFVEERAWERRRDFLVLNPAGTLPVLVEETGLAVSGPGVIAEYLEETRGLAPDARRLLPDAPEARAEVRRLVEWFNSKFFQEVTGYFVHEKVYKRHMSAGQGGGPPDMDCIRAGCANIVTHLRYIGWLTAKRNWLAGDSLTLADLAAAAHLSCADYLGDVPWAESENAKNWYARVKSRPSFRPLLGDRLPGMAPGPAYADLDF